MLKQENFVTNDLFQSNCKQFKFAYDRNTMRFGNNRWSCYCLDPVIWTPYADSDFSSKIKSRKVVIKLKELNDLMVPGYINDNVMDFMVDYMLRGKNDEDMIYGRISSLHYQAIGNPKTKSYPSCFGKDNWQFKNEIIFMPILVNKNHWVLVAMLNIFSGPKIVGKQFSKCLLYFDPLQKHRDPTWSNHCEDTRIRAEVHRNLLRWLNHERPKELKDEYTELNLPLICEFTKGE